jgi:hypothetical protein
MNTPVCPDYRRPQGNSTLVIFLTSTAISGMGYSLLFLGGLAEINAKAPAQQRGGILSALYLFAYLAMGTVAMVLGVVATKWGLGLAIRLGTGAIALLSGVTMVLTAPGSLKASADDEASAQRNRNHPGHPYVCDSDDLWGGTPTPIEEAR